MELSNLKLFMKLPARIAGLSYTDFIYHHLIIIIEPVVSIFMTFLSLAKTLIMAIFHVLQ